MTDLARLPPLPPIALSPTNQVGPTVFPSGPGGGLVAGMTDLAHLPPLRPIALSRINQVGPTLSPSGPGGDLVAGMTDLAHLPPSRPIALSRTNQVGHTLFPSGRGQAIVASMAVLMAGLVALVWGLRLDPSDGQVLVAGSTSFTLLAPVATCILLQSASRRARLHCP